MNRRGFFGALLALPAAIKAVALAKPRPATWVRDPNRCAFLNAKGEWIRDSDLALVGYDWKTLHAPIVYSGDKVRFVGETLSLEEIARRF